VAAEEIRNLIIVGSGPAGYTAAVYAARAQLEPLVFEGTQFGGALMTTTEVENFPGFRDGIMGPDLMEEMRKQAERFGAELRAEDVESLELTGDVKYVHANGKRYAARAVVLAMGAAARYLNVPGEQELLGRGVSACATCDGFFFRDHDIVVAGGGDSAMEEATFLTKFAKSVTIVHRREEFRASKIMIERARANEKIKWQLNSQITGVLGDGKVEGLQIKDTKDGSESTLVVTPEQRAVINLASGVIWERLTPERDPSVEFLRVTYDVGSESCPEDSLVTHGGREYAFVISGRLGVKLGFDEYRLDPGYSITFDATSPHRLWAIGDEPVEALWVVVGRQSDRRVPS